MTDCPQHLKLNWYSAEANTLVPSHFSLDLPYINTNCISTGMSISRPQKQLSYSLGPQSHQRHIICKFIYPLRIANLNVRTGLGHRTVVLFSKECNHSCKLLARYSSLVPHCITYSVSDVYMQTLRGSIKDTYFHVTW
jgi:hypothetical protein